MREYNQSYNFFAGMNDDAVLAYQKDALTGHRPTWKMGTGKARRRGRICARSATAADPFGLFGEGCARSSRPSAETRAESAMPSARRSRRSASKSAPRRSRSRRFKELVKRHHPDANGGDRSTEDRLVEIIQAYNYLKSVGFG